MRIGTGYDIHPLAEGRKLIIGGVEIPYQQGLLGHSDADVLLHAICDALLGAAALGDIGQHFPPQDMRYKDVSSLWLLSQVFQKINQAGFAIVNIDSTIVAQQPKMAPHIKAMQNNIAEVLGLPLEAVNIKASTTEHLGPEGRGEGISAQAVVLLRKD